MKNLSIELEDRPGALAEVGEILGRAGISIEGGGAWAAGGRGVGNFLFEDGAAARAVLEAGGIRVLQESEVVALTLDQDRPGQLGRLLRRMAEAGVNVEAQYSDHQHRLVLVVDEVARARAVAEAWMEERDSASAAQKPQKRHHYSVEIAWTGNTGEGTKNYSSYQRSHSISAPGKPAIQGSSDPAFRGDRARYNPEELFVASMSSCHMLWYLHLCAVNQVVVVAYEDRATGTMVEDTDSGGRFVEAQLHPVVSIGSGSDPVLARALHEEAHHNCYIANSVKFAIRVDPVILPVGGSVAQPAQPR